MEINYKIIGNSIYIDEPTNYCDYSTYISLYILESFNGDIKTSITLHTGLDETLFKNIEDGYYKLYKVLIPKLKYVDTTDINRLLQFDNFIVFNNGIYKLKIDSLQDISIQELLTLKNSNITVILLSLFKYSHIRLCLLEYLKAYLGLISLEDLSLPYCSDCRNIPKKDLYNRINYINTCLFNILYFVSCMNYLEALKLLQLIPYCDVKERNNK